MERDEDVQRASVGYDISRPFGSFVEVVREVLLHPAEFFRRLGEPGPYGLRGPILFSIASTLVSLVLVEVLAPLDPLVSEDESITSFFPASSEVGLATMLLLALLVLVLLSLGAILALYVGAAFQHIFVWIFVRERKGYWGTFPVIGYGVNAALLFVGIPILGLLAYLLAIYITAIGLREVHGTITTRAVLAALGPWLLIAIFTLPSLL